MKVVIVGNGIAGNQVAFSIRQRCKDTEICIVSAEAVPEYDPCSLPYFLGGDCEERAVYRKQTEDYQKHRIDLVYNSKVVSISPQEKTITTENGKSISYDKLVLAHGGDLFIPPIEGIRNNGVFSCKQLNETLKLRSHTGTRAVVIGSGAIGIEAAEALKKRGYAVTIIELLGWILPALFDEVTAKRLETAMAGYGIDVFTEEKVLRIQGDDRVTGVVTDKREIPCDTVVVATGVVPWVALAQTAGIATGRGIQVDRTMRTSVDDIYACGDCIETIDACTGEIAMFQLKHNAIEQGQIVARNIMGETVKYLGAYAFARAHFFDTHAVTFGKTMRATDCVLGDKELIEKENGSDYLRVILLDGKVVGGQAIGRYANDIGYFIAAMWRKDDMNRLRSKVRQLPADGAVHAWNQLHMEQVLKTT
ncbi:NAD(P)/FAD-dependent oxidoreductase [Desulfosarcina ovata]|uniref:NADH oxidase n=1 Tax=Desulfosarcina ovata subsp. ovata TaxID=2752305 RepID=A0A5K8AJM7_9BACT|nr:FAD-dependent oxidoreductase [Desulfosarcina ovata]BBO92907.1 NADH oxidase [Desulfosarcina ovata subsp. ovata]